MIEWIALALYVFVFARTIPIFLKANGTRPSIMFAMFATVLFGATLVHRLYGDSRALWTPVAGIVFACGVLAYVEWAARYHFKGEN